LLLRRAFGACGLQGACAPASAPPLAPARLLLLAGLTRRLLRTLLWTLLLLLLRRTGSALAPRLVLLPLLLWLPGALAALTLPLARLLLAIVATRSLAGALLKLPHLLLHESLRLAGLLQPQLVVPAVRATLPSLGIGLLAGRAEDAFRQRHREIGAHCTLRAVDETRRRTLQALLQLAGESSPSACWDDERAVELLRRQATPEELRELGADEKLLEHIYTEKS